MKRNANVARYKCSDCADWCIRINMDCCAICLSAPATVTLSPCQHLHLCPSCTLRLPTAACPTCRTPIFSATFPNTKPPTRDFAKLLDARARRDNVARCAARHVFVGCVDDVDGAQVLVKRARRFFPWPDENEPQDELWGLGYRSVGGDAMVDGMGVRFDVRLLTVDNWRAEQLNEVRNHKPMVMLVASAHRRVAFSKLVSWDGVIRKYAPEVRRVWVFLAGGDFTEQNVDLKGDVGTAWEQMGEERPRAFWIVRPRGWGVKKVLRDIAKCAWREGD